MVYPVSGPFFKLTYPGPFSELRRTWYRQKRPYNIPLGFELVHTTGFIDQPDLGPRAKIPIRDLPWLADESAGALNPIEDQLGALARDKLWSKVKGKHTAALGTSLAEVSESVAMVADRAASIAKAYKALKRGRLGDLWDALALKDTTSRARARRVNDRVQKKRVDVANGFLELQFGWLPLIQDIHDAIDTLQNAEYRIGPVSASARHTWREVDHVDDSQHTRHRVTTGLMVTRIAATISVSNPNVALANSLGLVNPATVVWNVIPFTYLINWFVPVEQFLNSYSCDWGFNSSSPYYTRFRQGRWEQSFYWKGGNQQYNSPLETCYGHSVFRGFYGTTPPHVLGRVKLPGGDLLGKASTSVATLVQQLAKRK